MQEDRHTAWRYDTKPVSGATLADLHLRIFEEEYLPAAVAPDVLADNDRTVEQRLAACKMIASVDDPVPTVLGLLIVGRQPREWLPGAYVQFVRFLGDGPGDEIGDALLVDGSVGAVVRRTEEKLQAHNRIAVDLTSGPVERRREQYPLAALQQVVRNALLHRTYEATHSPVRVSWFDDRIEVISPGGPFGAVTPERFGQPGVTDYRNPNLAAALRVLGLTQRYGAGLPLAQRALQQNGSPPLEFEVSATFIRVVLRPV
ncbi:MAG: hypothetical protein IT204_22095 [Fimbriimonadaceae bacterium]|nr:hypothetical protein [Fimbriimonadaceae bacterium]